MEDDVLVVEEDIMVNLHLYPFPLSTSSVAPAPRFFLPKIIFKIIKMHTTQNHA